MLCNIKPLYLRTKEETSLAQLQKKNIIFYYINYPNPSLVVPIVPRLTKDGLVFHIVFLFVPNVPEFIGN